MALARYKVTAPWPNPAETLSELNTGVYVYTLLIPEHVLRRRSCDIVVKNLGTRKYYDLVDVEEREVLLYSDATGGLMRPNRATRSAGLKSLQREPGTSTVSKYSRTWYRCSATHRSFVDILGGSFVPCQVWSAGFLNLFDSVERGREEYLDLF